MIAGRPKNASLEEPCSVGPPYLWLRPCCEAAFSSLRNRSRSSFEPRSSRIIRAFADAAEKKGEEAAQQFAKAMAILVERYPDDAEIRLQSASRSRSQRVFAYCRSEIQRNQHELDWIKDFRHVVRSLSQRS